MIHKKGYTIALIMLVLLAGVIIAYLAFGGVKTAEKHRTIEEVKERNEDWLMSIENVTGVGIGETDGELRIKVYVVKKTPELNKSIPKEIEGYKVDVEETGEIVARK